LQISVGGADVTFRGRLLIFFALMVVVPMVATGVVLFLLVADSERGKTDAGIAAAFDIASSVYTNARAAAADDLRRLARDDRLSAALRRGDERAAAERLRRLVGRDPALVSASFFSRSGDRVVRVGSSRGVAPAVGAVTTSGGEQMGTMAVSVLDARRLVATVRRRTGFEVLVLSDGFPVASSVAGVSTAPRGSADFRAAGRDYRGRRATVGEVSGTVEEVAVFRRADELRAAIREARLMVGAVLLALFLFAFASSVYVVRALQAQIGRFLDAARRLAGGRFDVPVNTEGNDEFAQLGREFNSMSKQLEAKIDEVEGKRAELQETIRRVGQAFAAGLDPQGLFKLAVQTAVLACEAEAGHGLPLDSHALSEARAGSQDPALTAALERAEHDALEGAPGAAQQHSQEGLHTLALPLRARLGTTPDGRDVAVIAIVRHDRPFDRQEVELLEYLAGQAIVSIENARLHEMVRRQAITDELTGLANVRQMHDALDLEFERGYRHDTPVGFVLLDVDDFKRVNDTFGHQQGDEVLREVAGVLTRLSREIDEPARYGGEELAVVLPQTSIEGAEQLAERIRERIEELRIPLLEGGGDLQVTASFGVASVPANASDKNALVAAADAALYRAKRAGKNRVERAGSSPGPS